MITCHNFYESYKLYFIAGVLKMPYLFIISYECFIHRNFNSNLFQKFLKDFLYKSIL
jgi:hypothetical protein